MNRIDIKDYGYTEFYEKQVQEFGIVEKELIPGRVVEVHKDQYKIITEYGETDATLKGSIFYNDRFTKEFPTVGDFLLVKNNPMGEDVIYEVLQRKSKFSRMDSWNRKEQLVAANFDYVFITVSLNHDFNIKRIERYLACAWQSGATPVMVLTKKDLCEDCDEIIAQLEEIAFGVDIMPVSSYTGEGILELDKYIKPGKTIVFLGSSGVGKSSLVNAIAGNEIMKVNEIREDDSKGRHTTTHRQLSILKDNTMVIDTPGMREMEMWDAQEGIDETFSEIEELSKQCKFNDCSHNKEPNCAVKQAIENGTLSEKRYKNYIKMQKEAVYAKNKENRKAILENAAIGKKSAKFQRR